jgi:D-beta-D-heptose 7-phosphate kinase / D-beta-D-heptose 1-phosphate adenosyltransferase
MILNIPNINMSSVLVIGDLMLDRYWQGTTSRISPEAPVPVVRVEQFENRPGGAGNVAVNIAALGAKVSVDGFAGVDEAGELLEVALRAAGVHCCFERHSATTTISKLRVLSRHQQLIRLDFEDGFVDQDYHALVKRFHRYLMEADVVVLSDYAKGTLHSIAKTQDTEVIQEIIGLARAADKPVLVDPKGSNFEIYRGATVLTPNLAEFETIVGNCANDDELEDKGRTLVTNLDLNALLITRGDRGMSLLQRDQDPLHIPARAREVFDVTGAGDTVIAVMATAVAAGETLSQAAMLANLAAGIVVGKLGAATVTVAELQDAVAFHHSGSESSVSCIVNEDELVNAVRKARNAGEKIVMTNGCFDIIHAGHTGYLERARQLGQRLIVAVNDDDSVKRLKGRGRPVNSLAKRMRVLAAMKYVDWVVPFSEDTPERLICRILPDVLVKGGDYKPQEVAGFECVTRNGGDVMVLDYEQGCSTTDIIELIHKSNQRVT